MNIKYVILIASAPYDPVFFMYVQYDVRLCLLTSNWLYVMQGILWG